MATHSDKTVLKNSFIGAVVALLFNILLTVRMGANGSAVVWVIAECVIMGLSAMAIYKKFNYIPPYKRILAYCLSYAPLLLLSLLIYSYLDNTYAIVSSLAILAVVYATFIELFILKNKVALQVIQSIHVKLKK
jgi:peptidoglycan biosynthesis protein MviN/MurJ (putative lipid II flippase)